MSCQIPNKTPAFEWSGSFEPTTSTSRREDLESIDTRAKKVARRHMEVDETPKEITWELLKSKTCKIEDQIAFIEQCDNINASSPDGDSFFFVCLKNARSHKLVMKCFEKGASVEAYDKDGKKPLWVLRDLLEKNYQRGMDYNQIYRYLKDRNCTVAYNHTSIIHEAAKRGKSDVVLSAVRYGQDIFKKNDEGRTAIGVVMQQTDTQCRIDVMDWLLEKMDANNSLFTIDQWVEIMEGDQLLGRFAAMVTAKDKHDHDILDESVKLDMYKCIPFHEYQKLFIRCLKNIQKAAVLFPLFLEAGRRCASRQELTQAIQEMNKEGQTPDQLASLVEFMNKMMI